ARCLIFCDETDPLPDLQARAILTHILAAPLPDGLKITAMREGGFQDAFYQARLTGDADAVAALLELGGADPKDLTTDPLADLGPVNTDWWDAAAMPDLRTVQLTSPTLPYLAAGVAPDPALPGQFIIYLWGFET
ncbi:MAG: hypothetical protein ACRC6I_19295, partial [Paracoccaceae bacterium]